MRCRRNLRANLPVFVGVREAGGRFGFRALGQRIEDPVRAGLDDSPRVLFVDGFGNLISNIDAALLEAFKEPVAELAGHQITMQTTYGRAQPGDYLALVNSFGVVEIARAEGSAADGLGSARGAPLVIRDGYKV